MDSFIKKAERLSCDKMVVVSKIGFTEPAIRAAREAGVETWILRPIKESDLEGYIHIIRGRINYTIPVIKKVDLRFHEKVPDGFPSQITEEDKPALNIYNKKGVVKGNIWDFVYGKKDIKGNHEFILDVGDHLYWQGEVIVIKNFSVEVDENAFVSPWEVDMEKDLLATYEDARDSKKVRLIRKNPDLPFSLQTLKREDFE